MLVIRGLGSTTILTDGLGGKTAGNRPIFVTIDTTINNNLSVMDMINKEILIGNLIIPEIEKENTINRDSIINDTMEVRICQ